MTHTLGMGHDYLVGNNVAAIGGKCENLDSHWVNQATCHVTSLTKRRRQCDCQIDPPCRKINIPSYAMPLTPLPSLSILNSTAHSLTLHLIPPDDFIPEDSPISYADPFQYQVSRSEEDDPDAIVVYEGTGLKVEVEGLKPVTNYRLKVRVRESEEFGGDWSSEFIECTGKTIGKRSGFESEAR